MRNSGRAAEPPAYTWLYNFEHPTGPHFFFLPQAPGAQAMTTHPLDGYQIKIEPSARHVRVVFGGEVVASSRRALLVHERGRAPVYYFPAEDVREDCLRPSSLGTRCALKGQARHWHIAAGGRVSHDAVWRYDAPTTAAGQALRHCYSFYWDRVDAWYEEGDRLLGHARDPYKRVDALPGDRHVHVAVAGRVVAESRRPVVLFESGAAPRFYLPRGDVDFALLAPSDTRTACPYKGRARYWSARVGDALFEDVAWSYEEPLPGAAAIAELVAFHHERLDQFTVDGAPAPPAPARRSALDYFGEGEFFA